MSKVVLAADVGGTNTRVAFFSKGKMVRKWLFDSRVFAFDEVVDRVLSADVKIAYGCIAAAGLVSPDRKTCKLTNARWKIDVRELPFNCFLLNDFEALGYGVNVFSSNDVRVVRKGKPNELPIGLIGAGTGFGKSLLVHNGKYYVPLASEGGHGDLPLRKSEMRVLGDALQYEDVLSGCGITRMYQAYGGKKKVPEDIMKENSQCAKKTKALFTVLYARCAKNFALDGLTRGGIIIGGGIAAQNPELFGKAFLDEFVKCEKQRELLEKVPIKVITNYDAGLYGAAFVESNALL